jgi:hypothetical protein
MSIRTRIRVKVDMGETERKNLTVMFMKVKKSWERQTRRRPVLLDAKVTREGERREERWDGDWDGGEEGGAGEGAGVR